MKAVTPPLAKQATSLWGLGLALFFFFDVGFLREVEASPPTLSWDKATLRAMSSGKEVWSFVLFSDVRWQFEIPERPRPKTKALRRIVKKPGLLPLPRPRPKEPPTSQAAASKPTSALTSASKPSTSRPTTPAEEAELRKAFGVFGPEILGGSVFVGVSWLLVEIEHKTGRVLRRLTLPGALGGLERVEQEILVRVKGERAYRSSSKFYSSWRRTYKLSEGKGSLPFFWERETLWKGRRYLFSQAARHFPVALEQELHRDLFRSPHNLRRLLRTKLSAADAPKILLRLQAAEEQDRTNPWHPALAGLLLDAHKRKDEAQKAYQGIFSIRKENQADLLEISRCLPREIQDKAFFEGMRFLLEQGYEPEMNRSLLNLIGVWSRPRETNPQTPKGAREPREQGKKLALYAPLPEGASYFYHALHQRTKKAGLEREALFWKKLTDESMPYRTIGRQTPEVQAALYGLNFFLAGLLALFLCFFLKTLRTAWDRLQPRPSWWIRWNPFVRWDRTEVFGFLLLIAALHILGGKITQGVGQVSFFAQMPMSLAGGQLSHPSLTPVLSSLPQAPESQTFQALSHLQAGRLNEASVIYRSLPRADAKNNLGVVFSLLGNREEARRWWTFALELEPHLPEAHYNLWLQKEGSSKPHHKEFVDIFNSLKGKPFFQAATMITDKEAFASWLRIARHLSLSVKRPLAVLPTGQDEEAFYYQASAQEMPFWRRQALVWQDIGQVFSTLQQDSSSFSPFLPTVILLFVILSLLALLISRDNIRQEPSPTGRLGEILSYSWPGLSPFYSFLGPLLAALTGGMALGFYIWTTQGTSTSILAGIAIPNFARYYGVAEMFVDPLERLSQILAWAVWPLLLFHALLSLVSFQASRKTDL